MATRISDSEWPGLPPGGKYPWDKWLDGGVWELVPGVDYTVRPGVMRVAAHAAARTRGGRARTTQQNGHMLIQFLAGRP